MIEAFFVGHASAFDTQYLILTTAKESERGYRFRLNFQTPILLPSRIYIIYSI